MDYNRRTVLEEVRNNDNEARKEYAEDILDILLDEDNRNPIILADERERQITFEQVAIIPRGEGTERRLYVILKPMDQLDGIKDDEAIVFYVDADDCGNHVLRVEENESVAVEIFSRYYDMLEAANVKATESKRSPDFIEKLIEKLNGDNK